MWTLSVMNTRPLPAHLCVSPALMSAWRDCASVSPGSFFFFTAQLSTVSTTLKVFIFLFIALWVQNLTHILWCNSVSLSGSKKMCCTFYLGSCAAVEGGFVILPTVVPANTPDFPERLPLFHFPLPVSPPGVTILLHFFQFKTHFHTFSLLNYHNVFLALDRR